LPVLIVLGVTRRYVDVAWKGLGRDGLQLPGVLPRLSGVSWREALGSMGVKRRNKVTAFNQEAQDARCGDPGTRVIEPVDISIELNEPWAVWRKPKGSSSSIHRHGQRPVL